MKVGRVTQVSSCAPRALPHLDSLNTVEVKFLHTLGFFFQWKNPLQIFCTPPVQDAEKTTDALWTSSVEVFEAGAVAALPMISIAGAVLSKPVVHFSSHGPVISTMTGADEGVVDFLKADLKDDGTTAAITFRISDNDSALKDVKLTAAVDKAGAKLVTAWIFSTLKRTCIQLF